MPISIIGSNLNTFGDQGRFETDRSTWGFSNTTYVNFIRSNVQQSAGLYSCRCFNTWWTGSFPTLQLTPGRFIPVTGKKYIIRAKVYVPSGQPIADNARYFVIPNPVDGLTTIVSQTTKTVADCSDEWQTIETKFEVPVAIPWGYLNILVRLAGEPDTLTEFGGFAYIDEFDVYEYIDVVDPEEPEPEPDPNPHAIDTIYHSKNPITLPKSAPAGWDELTNFRLWNEVHVEDEADSGTFVEKLTYELTPASDGSVVFILNEAFRDIFTFVPPNLNESDILRLTDRLKRFKCFTGSLQEDETEPVDPLTEESIHAVVFGGISKEKFPGLNYFTDYMPDNKKFLTWAPIQKEVDRLQEDYLLFLVYGEFNVLQLMMKVYFTDGTDEEVSVQTITGANYGELYQIPAGPQNTGVLLVDPEKVVSKYELWLLDQDDTVITEVRTYAIAETRHPLTRFIMFLTSLGGFEVIRLTGAAAVKTQVARDVINKFLPHDYAALDGELEVNNTTIERSTNFSTGFIKGSLARQWHEYMIDFLNSKRIYNVTTGDRVPVVITSADHVTEDQNYEFFVRFDARNAYSNDSFTPSEI
jgi:hypothetical protein